MAKSKHATIRDVAERAEVSIATVSYVINGTGQVGPAARKRVLEAIRELNYSTNRLARSLRTSRSRTIGVIAEDVTVFNAPKIIDGVNEYAEQHDFHIVLSNLRLNTLIGRDFERIEEYFDEIRENTAILHGRRIEGLIYIGQHMRNVKEVLDPSPPNTVYIYAYTYDPVDYCVNFDDREAGYRATEYLLSLGHRRIAIVEGLRDSSATQNRYEGYSRALADHGIEFDRSLVEYGDWEYESGRVAAYNLLNQADPPTAVFALNDVMAVGVIDEVLARGGSVPGDLSVIGFDNREFSQFYRPHLTTMEPPLELMGREAARISISRAAGEPPSERRPRLLCRLIPRESCAPPSDGR